MSVYLHDIPLPEARLRLEAALRQAGLWGRLGSETIPLDESAVGRVLAEPVWAKISSPHYHASAMDGFAVRSAATQGAMPNAPVTLFCDESGAQQRAAYLDTGDPLPDWADAVIPVENVEPLDEHGRPTAETRRPRGIRIRAGGHPLDLCPPARRGHRRNAAGAASRAYAAPGGPGRGGCLRARAVAGCPPAACGDPADRHRAGADRPAGESRRHHRVQFDGHGGPGQWLGRAGAALPDYSGPLRIDPADRAPGGRGSTTWCCSTPARRPARRISLPG